MSDAGVLAVSDVLSALNTPGLFQWFESAGVDGYTYFEPQHRTWQRCCLVLRLPGLRGNLWIEDGEISQGCQFGKLACDLVGKLDAKHFRAKTYVDFGDQVSLWTLHVRLGRRCLEQAFDIAGREVGNIEYTKYYPQCCNNGVIYSVSIAARTFAGGQRIQDLI